MRPWQDLSQGRKMQVYKITNIQNNKVYIGQTIRGIQERFARHIKDAMSNRLDTHFARAIRKYGPENFIIEKIDTAETQEDLNRKEQYWIVQYNSVKDGYNETSAIYKCGGNTYQSKTEEEMEVIKEKIRKSKLGENNPMARKVKRINVVTGDVDYFDTVIDCARHTTAENNKGVIIERLRGRIKSPYKNTWLFEYCDE